MSQREREKTSQMQKPPSRHLLKILALILSTTLWFYVLNSEPLEVERRVELVFINPPDLAINVEVPKYVRVKLKGSRAFVKNLDLTQEKMIIDLQDYPYSQETFPVTFDSSMVQIPFGIEVLEIFPQQVVLSLEREIRKVVPVRLRTVGEVGKDFRLVKKDFSPKEFMIRGPYTEIKKVGLLETFPVDLEALESSGDMKLRLTPLDSRIHIEDLKDIHFSYILRPNKANLKLRDVKVNFLSSHRHYTSHMKKVDLDILVSGDREEDFSQENITVVARLIGLKRGHHKVPLKVELPEGVHLLKIIPELIDIRID